MRRENVRQLSQREPDLSHRQLGERLGISKDTVRRDLDAIAEEAGANGAAPGAPTAPQASVGGAAPDAPDEPDESRRALPRQMAPLAGAPDLSQWPALRRALAVLAQSGMSAEQLVHQAVLAVEHEYRQALDRGEMQLGDRFLVSGVTLRPAALIPDCAVPDPAQLP